MTVFSVNPQGGMQEYANLAAVSHRAASAAGMALITQFGGILDGQDMTPGYAVRNFLPAMVVKLFNRDGLVPQQCPFFSRSSPKLPTSQQEKFHCRPNQPANRESHCHDQHNVLPLAESVGRTRREVFTDQPWKGVGYI
jgi:hypothetical protein